MGCAWIASRATAGICPRAHWMWHDARACCWSRRSRCSRRHTGGARRVAELAARLATDVDFSCSATKPRYTANPANPGCVICAVHCSWKVAATWQAKHHTSLPERSVRHAWPGLRAALETAAARFRPDIVQVDYMGSPNSALKHRARRRACAAVPARRLPRRARSSPAIRASARRLRRYDAVVACSDEDATDPC